MDIEIQAVAQRHGLHTAQVLIGGDAAALPVWNAEVSSRPAAVIKCADVADIQAGVRMADELDLPLSVFGVGHDITGRSVKDGGLVIDISGLRTIDIDTEARTARMGGAVRSDELARETEAVGLTPVTGTVGSVGMLGLTLGGGYGPLNGRFGLACDNLLSAELVTAKGAVVHVDARTEPDLLWALRGGGGNFGVVTSAEIRLHAVGNVYTGMIIYSWDQVVGVLLGLERYLASSPDELSIQTIISTGLDGDPFVALMPTWSGPLEQGPAAVEPLTRLGDPVSSHMAPSSYHGLIAGVSESFPRGRHVRMRTRNVPGFSPSVVQRIVEAGSSWTSPLSALSIHPFHGAATRVPLTDTAFGERSPHQMIEIVGMWESEGQTGGDDAAWADRVHASLAADAMPGGYPNLLTAADDGPQVRDAYGPNADRLLAVKARTDPSGVFCATPFPTSPGSVQ